MQTLTPENELTVWRLDANAPETDGLWDLGQVYVGDSTEVSVLWNPGQVYTGDSTEVRCTLESRTGVYWGFNRGKVYPGIQDRCILGIQQR